MSVAFEIEVTRSRAGDRCVAIARAIPAVGLLLAALHVAGGPTAWLDAGPDVRWATAAVLGMSGLAGLAFAASVVIRRPTGAIGRILCPPSDHDLARTMRVDADGVPSMPTPEQRTVRPLRLRVSCILPGLTVLVLAPCSPQDAEGRRARAILLSIGRDAVSGDAWRRLHVWLRWTERGRHDARPTLRPDRT